MSLGSIWGAMLLAILVLGMMTPSIIQLSSCPPRMCSMSWVMYAPGTKSVIIAILLVRSAPGVRAMSWRLISVVGVTLSTLVVEASVVTTTDCWTAATCNSKCRTGVVPEAIVMLCLVGL